MKGKTRLKVCLLGLRWTGSRFLVRASSDYQATAQPIMTDSGLIDGHPALDSAEVSEYLGIPFAKPPVGDLRFAPPQPYFSNATVNGTSFGYSCPISSTYTSLLVPRQDVGLNFTAAGVQLMNAIAQSDDNFSEDCLTLNVWTKRQSGEKQKAVLLWIYGGGYVAGNSDAHAYNGAYFADQEDVIIVSINYRVNIFGFPGFPGGSNLGLLDQRLAVEWVRDNIAAFGGDPARITLFGQSAGGGSVDLYSYAWPNDPIVAGLIAQSGTVEVVPPNNASTAAQLWFNTSSILGCGDEQSDLEQVLSCMRGKDTNDIVETISRLPNFKPIIDEQVIFSDYDARSLSGNFIKKPLLIGNADFESGLFDIISLLKNVTIPASVLTAFDLETFECPAAKRANVSVYNNVPVWRYRYFGEFPNMQLSSTIRTGAYHGAEVNVLFNTLPVGDGIPESTEEEVKIGNHMRGAWAAFAKDPERGLSAYGWPKFDPKQETLIRLAYGNKTEINAALSAEYDLPCGENSRLLGLMLEGETG